MTPVLDSPPAPLGGGSVLAAAVERAEAALGEAAQAPSWSLTDAELTELVGAAGRLAARAQGLLLRVVGEADAREVWTAEGATSSAAFLRGRLRMSPAEAASCAKTARAVRAIAGRPGAACAAGRITGGQAAVIGRAVGDLPSPRRPRAARESGLHASESERGDPTPPTHPTPARQAAAVAMPSSRPAAGCWP